jgi:hypothetical protein
MAFVIKNMEDPQKIIKTKRQNHHVLPIILRILSESQTTRRVNPKNEFF